MIFQSEAFSVTLGTEGIAELKFDFQNESVNKFNKRAILDLKAAVEVIGANSEIKGLVISSGKSTFVVGADITEFGEMFAGPEDALITR